MSRLITAAERIKRARALIQEARDYSVPLRGGKYDLSYMAQVRGLLRQARDLIKFIPSTPSATTEMKEEVRKTLADVEQAGHVIFRG